MAGKDIIMATQEELKALHVIRKAIDKAITQREAADIIDMSERQVRRKVSRVRQEGDKGIIHRLRGRSSNRAKPQDMRNKVLGLCRTTYRDFGPTLASEKLFERDKIRISDETLRLWLIDERISYKQRKKRPHRQWRERKHYAGEMVQLDGSHHDWFEGRGPFCVLMGYIDDATGTPHARFYEYEGTLPAMGGFKRYIERYGIPQSVYLDKHSTYKFTGKLTIEQELNNTELLSQFERALKELDVLVIHANSPQAKGRIERLFKTFQDRLVKEMRLAGIKTIQEGNKFLERYLPIYIRKFAVKPAKEGDMHRPLPKDLDLDRILCIKTKHAIRNDFTVAHNKKLYQIKSITGSGEVMVEEHINGSMILRHKDNILRYEEITVRPQKQYEHKVKEIKRIARPSMEHPLKRALYERRQRLNNYLRSAQENQKESQLIKA